MRQSKKVEGAALVPNLTTYAPGTTREYVYWVGILPKSPVEGLTCAGISFPKMNERLIPDPSNPGQKRRIPVIGALVKLTREKLELMAARIPRTVVRFLDEEDVKDEPGTGENLGDLHRRARRGHLITIPSDEDIADRRARGKATQAYVQREGDEPAARFMFAMLCKNQTNPERGEFYPDVLENTGLSWPEEEVSDDERNTDRSGNPDAVAQRDSDSRGDALLG